MSNIANDDYPILVVSIVHVGNRPASVYLALREVLGVTPAAAKHLLATERPEVARGCRMDVESTIHRFQRAGATVSVEVVDPKSSS